MTLAALQSEAVLDKPVKVEKINTEYGSRFKRDESWATIVWTGTGTDLAFKVAGEKLDIDSIFVQPYQDCRPGMYCGYRQSVVTPGRLVAQTSTHNALLLATARIKDPNISMNRHDRHDLGRNAISDWVKSSAARGLEMHHRNIHSRADTLNTAPTTLIRQLRSWYKEHTPLWSTADKLNLQGVWISVDIFPLHPYTRYNCRNAVFFFMIYMVLGLYSLNMMAVNEVLEDRENQVQTLLRAYGVGSFAYILAWLSKYAVLSLGITGLAVLTLSFTMLKPYSSGAFFQVAVLLYTFALAGAAIGIMFGSIFRRQIATSLNVVVTATGFVLFFIPHVHTASWTRSLFVLHPFLPLMSGMMSIYTHGTGDEDMSVATAVGCIVLTTTLCILITHVAGTLSGVTLFQRLIY
eukprot:Lankesteria_metandrocarpae@DN5578_c0_g1_i1.p1